MQDREKESLNKEREITNKLKQNLNSQQNSYQQLADKYFNTRKQLKKDF